MAANLGAHETMEVHEILTTAINGINHFNLYSSFVQDQRLRQILNNQLQFMINEYNQMVNTLNNQGNIAAVPYRSSGQSAPIYGLDNPVRQSPNMNMNQFDDRDISSSMLACHKSSATMKMIAALECADPQLRRMMQQGAVNCAEQAYEVWQYMNHMGYYQVPTMKQETTNTILNTYQSASNPMNMGMEQRFQ